MTQTLQPTDSPQTARRAAPSVRGAKAEPGPGPGAEPGTGPGTGQDAEATERATATAPRRGPFRPGVWLNTRQRASARLAAHAFHMTDLAAIWGVTLYWVVGGHLANLPQAPVSRVLPLILAALTVQGLTVSLSLYRFRRGHRLVRHLAALATVILFGGGLAALVVFAVAGIAGTEAELSRLTGWVLSMLCVLGGLHLVWSRLVRRWHRIGALTPNIVVVGATRNAERLIQEALKRRDLNVLGVFDDRLARSPDAVAGVPVLGRADDLLKHRMIPYVDQIVVAIDPTAHNRVRELTARLQVLPNEVSLLVDPQGDAERDVALEKLAQAPLSPLKPSRSPDRAAFNKRLQDVLVGSLALVLFAPILGLVALAIRLDSPGPIFFRQRRHGFNHEEIVVWKFRSMRHEAADATASRQVSVGDDRVTRVGRILRSTSLDELPQLLNVLKGEMSLVGPRPHAIGMKTGQVESAALVADYAHRHRMKPGMTGWAAVNGSRGPLDNAEDVRRRVQLDVDYIERQSFWLDLWIMTITVPVLLGDRAAVR